MLRCACRLALAATALALGPAGIAAGADPLAESFETLVAAARSGLDEHRVPGAAVGVLFDGRSFTRGIGVTSVEHPLPVSQATLFQIGSITKTFTGTLLVALAESRVLDLDAPLRRYLPEFRVADPEATARATPRDLLTHSGGWVGDEFLDTGAGDDALARAVASLAPLEQLVPFRSLWSYNNAGFYLAGRLVEVLTGQTYEAALAGRLLGPLELDACRFEPGEVMTRSFVVGHATVDGRPTVLRPWSVPRALRPVGGLACSVDGLLRYARFHLGDGTAQDGTRLVSPGALDGMRTPQRTKEGTEQAIGLTWHLAQRDGVRLVRHGGATLGQIASLLLVPERGFALVVLTNSSAGRPLRRDLQRLALREYLGIEIADPEPLAADEATLAQYVGLYERPFADVELKLEDGRLIAHTRLKQGFPTKDSPIPPHDTSFELTLYAPDRFVHASGPSRGDRAQILRDADGAITWLRLSSRLHRRRGDVSRTGVSGTP